MDGERDFAVLIIALGLSVLIHGTLIGLRVELWPKKRSGPETVTVQYLPAGPAEGRRKPKSTTAPAAAKKPTPDVSPPRSPEPAPRREVRGKKAAPSRPDAPESAEPRPETFAEKPPLQPQPPVQSAEPPAGAATPEPIDAGQIEHGVPRSTGGSSGSPTHLDLMPKPEDLGVYRSASAPPDPAGGQAREATVALGEPDVRYRTYLDRVQRGIDRSWRWREALLAAGRSGSVLLRFTVTRRGEVEDVDIEHSSGSPILDGEAVETVRRSPIPGFPSHWTITRLHLFAQFDYKLE